MHTPENLESVDQKEYKVLPRECQANNANSDLPPFTLSQKRADAILFQDPLFKNTPWEKQPEATDLMADIN